ncbi:MAG: hypothetical protein HY456_01480 [Parcubacteria group bacterium]|nr:hypothetical protein [Parcubacteria group bacterium]
MAREKKKKNIKVLELICPRCKLPIRKGALCVKRKDGTLVHWGCGGLATLGEFIDDHSIGAGD